MGVQRRFRRLRSVSTRKACSVSLTRSACTGHRSLSSGSYSRLSRILLSLTRHRLTISISRPSARRRWPCGTVSTPTVRPTLRNVLLHTLRSEQPTHLRSNDRRRSPKAVGSSSPSLHRKYSRYRIASLIDGANFICEKLPAFTIYTI